MDRISLPWVINVVRALDGLDAIKSGKKYGDVSWALYSAASQIKELFEDSVYSEFLLSSRHSADLLAGLMDQFLASPPDEPIKNHEIWVLVQYRRNFQTIFFAELEVFPSYYIKLKPPYDISTLLEMGEALMPRSLSVKVPEAVPDVREAGRALAFELGTACGFHTFRVLESVVVKYMSTICFGKVKSKNRNLGAYVRILRSGGADPKVIAALEQLKDLHRNLLIHPDVTISVEEAISILGIVRSAVGAMLNALPEPPPIMPSLRP